MPDPFAPSLSEQGCYSEKGRTHKQEGREIPFVGLGARDVNRGDDGHGDAGERPEDRVHDHEVDVHAPAPGEGWGSGFMVQGSGGGGGRGHLASGRRATHDTRASSTRVRISCANTYSLSTWFESKLLHVYFNITNKDRSL